MTTVLMGAASQKRVAVDKACIDGFSLVSACLVKRIEAKMSQNGPIFRSFEANSLPYLTKMIGKWGRFGAFAADSFFARQALIHRHPARTSVRHYRRRRLC